MVILLQAQRKRAASLLQWVTGAEVDVRGYNAPGKARLGHMELCEKWAAKEVADEEEEDEQPRKPPA